MKTTPVLLLVLLAFVGKLSYCKDFIIGDTINSRLIWQHNVEYNAIPFKNRVKEVFFSDPEQQLIIKGIIARDLDHTDAIPKVTEGGVGYSFFKIRLKSRKGSRLNYQLRIYE